MRITRVQLKNIKSYADGAEVSFAPDINAICGPNGAGKSTLLESIGFALFDALSYPQKQFLREGAKQGEIVVSFISALDEREYQVVRPVSGGQPYIYDPETQMRLVSGKNDSLHWLKLHLGVDPNGDLATLFNDAVGVPQGLLTAAFLESPRERKHKFDSLLQVDDYEEAWQRLRETGGALQKDLDARERRLIELQAELRRLPELESEAHELQAQLDAHEQNLADVIDKLEQAQQRRRALDELEQHVREAERTLTATQYELQQLTHRLALATADLQQAQDAQAVVAATRPAFTAHEQAQKSLDALEAQRDMRDELRANLARAEQAAALTAQRIQDLIGQIEQAQQAERRCAELRPLVAEQERLEAGLFTAKQQAHLRVATQKRLSEEQQRLDVLRADLARVQAQVTQLLEVEGEMVRQQEACTATERQLAQCTVELEAIDARRAKLRDALRLLEQGVQTECPVCHQALAPQDLAKLRQHYDDELSQLDSAEKAAKQQRSSSSATLRAAQGQLQALQSEANGLPRAGRLDELNAEIQDQAVRVAQQQEQLAALEAASAAIADLEQQLARLGNPRSECERASSAADARAKCDARLQQEQEKQRTQAADVAELTAQLDVLVSLDQRMAEQRQTLANTQADHRRYLEHVRAAESLPACEQRVNALRQEEARASERHAAQQRLHAELSAQYDATAHEQAITVHERYRQEHDVLAERVTAEKAQQARVASELQTLRKQEQERRQVTQERDALQRLFDTLEFIRKTIREAGPYVTQALVKTISAEADSIFGDIVSDRTMRLRWTEEYGIQVEQRGNEREFSQLSGGEKVASALAVRLALLRSMSGIRIAFFDEPTAHLDDQRRENLAAQIMQIRGFDQLFVISHDDTFERQTHHIVRVTKENGESRAEVI